MEGVQMSDTPISDSTPHNVADLGMLCRRLERELTAANSIIRQQQLLDEENLRLQDRIKRLEAGDAALNYSIGLGLQKENKALKQRIKRLKEALAAHQQAYTPDGHTKPHDCFATGPRTGDPIQDLVVCPGCWAEQKAKEAKP
jgi:hypothetical protein